MQAACREDLTPNPLSGAERGSRLLVLPLSTPERGLGGEVSAAEQLDGDHTSRVN
jgi:hypothetical protein